MKLVEFFTFVQEPVFQGAKFYGSEVTGNLSTLRSHVDTIESGH